MKKIVYLFPTNRQKVVRAMEAGQTPDNELYGLNYMGKLGIDGAYADVSPILQRCLDLLFSPLHKLFHWQIDIGFQLSRALLMLPKINQADAVLTNTDSIGLPVCLLKRLGLVKPPVVYAVGLFYIQGKLKVAIDSGKQTLFRSFYTWILSGADHIVYHSPIEKEKLVKLGLYNPAYCTFVPMGSDANFFRELASSSTINHQPSTILSIGRDHARDYETLFQAAEKLPELNFVVICSQRNIEGLEIPGNVKILMDLPYQKVAEWYQKSAVIVIPMKEMHRSSGQMTLTDAIQAGKPIIASDVVGIAHYGLKNGQDALLVSPGNAKQLAEAINKLILDETLRRKLGQGTRKLARRFTTENYAGNITTAVKLVTDEIRLRPLEKKDLEFMRRIRNENRQYFLDSSYISKPAQHKWFNQYRRKTDDDMFILEDRGKSIGVGAIYNINVTKKTAEIGRFGIAREYQERGHGKILLGEIEKLAWKEMGLHQLSLEVFEDNSKAIRLYERAGFVRCGHRTLNGRKVLFMIKSSNHQPE